MNQPAPDQSQRDLALDPTQSFIVQAPAGSGKTELLIQRFLALLARVSAPEEVVAITFTRKAAMEMRARMLLALNKAGSEAPSPINIHANKTWQLARAVLEQNHRQSWHLIENTGRLNVQTIDSLTHQIVRQSPLLAGFSPMTDITEDAQWLYTLAVRNIVQRPPTSDGDQLFQQALKSLLLHVNNDGTKLEALLTSMLTKRDQWLELGMKLKPREHLEAALKRVNQTLLEHCCNSFPPKCEETLLTLMRFSIQNQGNLAIDSWLKMPSSALVDKAHWQVIANFLLTKQGAFRETVGQSLGFPPESAAENLEERQHFKTMKARFKSLIQTLKPFESFRVALHALIQGPATAYTESQWHMLSSLTLVLKHLLAELKWVFHEKKRVDFIEMNLAAKEALGTEDQPTELGLMLDYKIQHLLMDEFQDTSMSQFQLIERLISGWQPGDGRTLFLVGDPMQSIYRFRQAEVGLFLTAQKKGLGNIPLISITLTHNFRSQAGLLDWVNHQFSQIFPPLDDVPLGAVSFSPSTASHPSTSSLSVFAHTVTPATEGDMLCALIQEKWQQDPRHRIAVLVRSRRHLDGLLPALSKTGLKYQALDIAPLRERPIVQDLYALTRVLLNPLDRLAWLSILRAPWCGLSLKDLHQLVYRTPGWNILNLLNTPPEGLSEEGRDRFLSTAHIVTSAIATRHRDSLAYWIQTVWSNLQGPLCYPEATQDVRDFFELLENIEKETGWIDLQMLDARLDKLFASSPIDSDDRLQLMTIHKSKGLEFDSVIILGLERKAKQDTLPLLRWLTQAVFEETADMLLAPIQAVGQEQDTIYRYLGYIEKNKQQYELVRLLYVAATRAKTCLHWVMRAETGATSDDLFPPTGSLLSLLSHLRFPSSESKHDVSQVKEKHPVRLSIRRLKSDYFSKGISKSAAPFVASETQPPLPQSSFLDDPTLLHMPRSDTNTIPLLVTPAGKPGSAAREGATMWHLPNFDLTIHGNGSRPPCRDDTGSQDDTSRKYDRFYEKLGNVLHRLLDQIIKQTACQISSNPPLTQTLQQNPALWKKLLIPIGFLPEQLPLAIDKMQQVLYNIQHDPIGQWLLDPTHPESHSEYAITRQEGGLCRQMRIDRTFLDAKGQRWIIDYKSTMPSHHRALEGFLEDMKTQHREQLEAYGSALGDLFKEPIFLGLYFPFIPAWCAWEYKNSLLESQSKRNSKPALEKPAELR